MLTKPWIACITLIAIIAFGALLVFTYQATHSHTVAPIPNSHVVLAVDLNNDKQITQAELLTGEDAIIAVQANPKISNPDSDILFSGFEELARLDSNKNGRIDSQDPVFSRLHLVFLINKGKDRKSISFSDAGIKAIIFDRELLASQRTADKSHPETAGHLLMNDGTTRSLRAVDVTV